ncbi:MAG: transporter [Capnocytophaga sp.]|nr:transporter [Capnocytophaga sp.]
MKKILFTFILAFISVHSYSQTAENDTVEIDFINTDRSDQSEGVYVLPKKMLQLEDGFTFANGSTTNNFMVRYGLFKNTEVRLATDITKYNGKIDFQDFVLSAKHSLLQENGWIPAVTLVGYLSFNRLPEKSFSNDWALAFQYTLSDKFSFDWNFALNNQYTNYGITAEINYSPIDKLGFFGEYFANFANATLPSHNIDAGVMYCFSKNFQIDMAYGRSVFTPDANDFFIVGLSYRFAKLK